MAWHPSTSAIAEAGIHVSLYGAMRCVILGRADCLLATYIKLTGWGRTQVDLAKVAKCQEVCN